MNITTAYFLAKEELPFSKFQGLINLHRKNDLDMSTYANEKSCAEMVSVVENILKEKTAQEIQ